MSPKMQPEQAISRGEKIETHDDVVLLTPVIINAEPENREVNQSHSSIDHSVPTIGTKSTDTSKTESENMPGKSISLNSEISNAPSIVDVEEEEEISKTPKQGPTESQKITRAITSSFTNSRIMKNINKRVANNAIVETMSHSIHDITSSIANSKYLAKENREESSAFLGDQFRKVAYLRKVKWLFFLLILIVFLLNFKRIVLEVREWNCFVGLGHCLGQMDVEDMSNMNGGETTTMNQSEDILFQ